MFKNKSDIQRGHIHADGFNYVLLKKIKLLNLNDEANCITVLISIAC